MYGMLLKKIKSILISHKAQHYKNTSNVLENHKIAIVFDCLFNSVFPHYTLQCVLQTIPFLWGSCTFILSLVCYSNLI